MIFLILFACSTSLEGDWTGTCTFEDGQNFGEMEVLAAVTRDNGYILEGKIGLIDWNEEKYSGDLSGDHSGKYVLMKTNIETDEDLYRFRLETVKFGQDLDGTCSIQSSLAPGGLKGDIVLER